ncbi:MULTISPECIES: hypothetical protein [Paraburkholderia]|uniref:Uncharacterized protein n=1 Tax=Paraburkholderia podalyriae TaxID=1938811 RepID=A0ABR7PQR1_9BURK|nr:hypothetical protein [Paraburkholderia podalyriae]MBC8748578.1 hypothetical protein [Paraburkholderia podalyriae]
MRTFDPDAVVLYLSPFGDAGDAEEICALSSCPSDGHASVTLPLTQVLLTFIIRGMAYPSGGTRRPTSNWQSEWLFIHSFILPVRERCMTSSGWDIAMRRIDAEYDLPQFLASSRVRKIAANSFRLPPNDRANYQSLPDQVVARIEQIVRDSYRDAGGRAEA